MLKRNNQDSFNSNGCISPVTPTTALFAVSALTMVLNPPQADGVLKMIQLVDATFSATVNIQNFNGSLTNPVTFSAAGDTLLLVSLGGDWVEVGGSLVAQQIAAAISSVTVGAAMIVSGAVSLTAGNTYTVPANRYAVLNWSGLDNTDTVAGRSITQSGITAVTSIHLGPGQSYVAGSASGNHVYGVEFKIS